MNNWLADKTIADFPPIGVCLACDYDLRGHDGAGTCPECGTTFSTNDVNLRYQKQNELEFNLSTGFILLIIVAAAVYAASPWIAVAILIGYAVSSWAQKRSLPLQQMTNTAIRADGISWYRKRERTHFLPWIDIKSIALTGDLFRGFALVIKRHSPKPSRALKLPKDRRIATKVVEHAQTLHQQDATLDEKET